MKEISKEVLINKYSKSIYEDAIFEYDLIDFKNFRIKEKDGGAYVVNVDVKEGNIYYSVLLNIKNDIIGFCDCNENNCKHQLFAALNYNEYVKKNNSSLKKRESDTYKIELLKKIYEPITTEDLIFIKVRISKIKDNKVKLGLKAGIVGEAEYVVNNMYSFLDDIYNKKELKFGKNSKSESYSLEHNSLNLFEHLRTLSIKFHAMKINPEKEYIEINELEDLLSILNNNEIIYDNLEYMVKDRLDDITLNIKSISDGFEVYIEKSSNYYKLTDKIVVNHINHYFYILDQKQIAKIDLIDSFLNVEKKIIIDNEEREEFLNVMLPKLYNEFNIILDFEDNLTIVDDKLETSLFCYLDNRIIHIKPRFMYGEYDAFENNEGILIRRNNKAEEVVINLLLNNGFVYDYYKREFVIQAERKQFIFLTKTLYDLRQDVDIFLDDKLKNALRNLTSNSVNITVNNNSEGNFFELDIDIEGIDLSSIDDIIKSFKAKKEFHRLESGEFISLVDMNVLEQLEFISEIQKETENSYHVPKYRAIYIKNSIDGLFNNNKYAKEFDEYISHIKSIKEIDVSSITSTDITLRDYQKTGINFIQNLYEAELGCLLADEMGLGKTLQTIMFLKYNNIKNTLIVVPKALLYNWKQEFEHYAPNMDVELIYENPQKRAKQVISSLGKRIVITSYNILVNDIELYEEHKFDTIIIDEAQYIKNPNSKTAQNVKKIKANFYLALTGTPIENNLTELWSIFDFILPKYLNELSKFKSRFITNKDPKITDIVSPFIIRRLKTDVLKQLPDKIEKDILCEMEDEQKKLYVKYAKNVSEEVNHYLNIKNLGQKQMQVLNAITRLRQLSLDPHLFIEEYNSQAGKIEVFNELINEIVSSEQKVVVFSQFTSMLDILKRELEKNEIKYYYLDGDVRPKQRMIDVEKFNKNKIPVYLISLKAGGVGLNLTSASNVIIYDPWWNPAVENQAIDRTHRLGQKNVVNVYRLISKSSIEEKILDIKHNKMQLLQDTIDNSEGFISELSQEQLVDLFYVEEME